MNWMRTRNELPEEGRIVLGFRNGNNWKFSRDPVMVNCVVVWLEKGITRVEREIMASCPLKADQERARTYTSADEFGNNLVPYRWHTFGPGSFFGQEIVLWTYIDDIPTELMKEITHNPWDKELFLKEKV